MALGYHRPCLCVGKGLVGRGQLGLGGLAALAQGLRTFFGSSCATLEVDVGARSGRLSLVRELLGSHLWAGRGGGMAGEMPGDCGFLSRLGCQLVYCSPSPFPPHCLQRERGGGGEGRMVAGRQDGQGWRRGRETGCSWGQLLVDDCSDFVL